MPTANYSNSRTDEHIIKQYDSASYQINGGSSIAGGTQSAPASAFTDSVTVTGLATTDGSIAICPRDAVVIPNGLKLVSLVITGANTLAITWINTTLNAITPPAAGVWSVAVLGNFYRG